MEFFSNCHVCVKQSNEITLYISYRMQINYESIRIKSQDEMLILKLQSSNNIVCNYITWIEGVFNILALMR